MLSHHSREMTLVLNLPPALSEYQLIKLIGSGGMGSVYTAVHIPTGYICAIKIISIKDENKALYEQILREIKIMSQFDHAFIIKLYNYYIDYSNGVTNAYIVMEYCENGSIINSLKKFGRFDERRAGVILIETYLGLLEMHKHNIIHRDLKLENILIDSHGHIRISDFGFSRELSLEQNSNNNILTFCGTPAYVAPEIIKKEKYSFSADVWSFGVILYTLLYGKYPFESSNIIETLKQIVTSEPAYSDDISNDANNLIKMMLQKDPNQRIKLIDIFDQSFFQIYKSIIYHDEDTTRDNTCYFTDLSKWTFPTHEKKVFDLTHTPTNEMRHMIKNHEINDKTTIFKIIRDKFLQDVIFSKFGGCETHYKKMFPRASIKTNNNLIEAIPINTNKFSICRPLKSDGSFHRRKTSNSPIQCYQQIKNNDHVICGKNTYVKRNYLCLINKHK